MKNIRLILLLVVLMISTLFIACGSKDKDTGKANESESVSKEEIQNKEEVQNNDDKLYDDSIVQKIGSVDSKSIYEISESGIIYKAENKKYGIMTLDGKKDTGAKYTSCVSVGDYFQVVNVKQDTVKNVTDLNCVGVVDVTGKEIIPMKYASIKKINERYIRVFEVTEKTTNKEEALVYYTNDIFSLSAEDDDILLKGKWFVYDMVAEKMLEGVSGTKSHDVLGYGNFVQYITDGGEKITINEKGEKLPEMAILFENGYYALTEDNLGAVYNSAHEKVFDYTFDGFVPSNSEGEYILAYKYDNNTRKYVLMDTDGNVVSAEFIDMPGVYGKLIHAGGKIYNFKGEIVIEGTYDSVCFDKQFENAWFLKKDNEYILIQEDGTVLYQGEENDVFAFDVYNFFIKKKNGEKNMYYSFKDKDFTIQGTSFAPWLVRVEKPDYFYDIVDTVSGKTIISGYKRYSYVTSGSDIYVYAQNEDGSTDIYNIK